MLISSQVIIIIIIRDYLQFLFYIGNNTEVNKHHLEKKVKF